MHLINVIERGSSPTCFQREVPSHKPLVLCGERQTLVPTAGEFTARTRPSQNEGEGEEPTLKRTETREVLGTRSGNPLTVSHQPLQGQVSPDLFSAFSSFHSRVRVPGEQALGGWGGQCPPPAGQMDTSSKAHRPESREVEAGSRSSSARRERGLDAHFLEGPPQLPRAPSSLMEIPTL